MDHKIMPNELFVTEFGAIIRTRCPKDHVTDEMVHQRVVAANLAAGDFVKVQCLNHERTTVLHFAEWLVFDRRSEMKRREINDREVRNFEDISFSVVRTTDWHATPAASDEDTSAVDDLEVKWNFGQKVFDVVSPDGTVVKSFAKEDGGKAAAEAFAKNPAPEAA